MNVLKELRKSRKLNQKDIADYLGITQQAYQKYEYGASEMSGSTITKLADFYGVTTDYLLGRETGEPETLDKLVGEFNMSALEKEILDNYLSLPKDMRSDLMEFLQKSVKKVMEESKSVQSNAQKQIKKSDTYNSEFAVARSSERDFLNVPDEETEATFTVIEPDPDF